MFTRIEKALALSPWLLGEISLFYPDPRCGDLVEEVQALGSTLEAALLLLEQEQLSQEIEQDEEKISPRGSRSEETRQDGSETVVSSLEERCLFLPELADAISLLVRRFLQEAENRELENYITDSRDTMLQAFAVRSNAECREAFMLWQGFSHLAWVLADELLADGLAKLTLAIYVALDLEQLKSSPQPILEELSDVAACYLGGRCPPNNGFAKRISLAIEDGLRIVFANEQVISANLEAVGHSLCIPRFGRSLRADYLRYVASCESFSKVSHD